LISAWLEDVIVQKSPARPWYCEHSFVTWSSLFRSEDAETAAGGMGEVYQARDTKLNRGVAIKVLPPAVASDPDRLAQFSREAQVLASLNHPNIAQIHGLEESAAGGFQSEDEMAHLPGARRIDAQNVVPGPTRRCLRVLSRHYPAQPLPHPGTIASRGPSTVIGW
jgi:hypothetical protein